MVLFGVKFLVIARDRFNSKSFSSKPDIYYACFSFFSRSKLLLTVTRHADLATPPTILESSCRFFLVSTIHAVTTTAVISAVTIKYIQSDFDTA